jgi:predicted transposase YdaD
MVLAEKNQTLSRAFEQLKLISADEDRRMLYEARLKELRDWQSIERTAEKRGREEGKIEGRIEAAQEIFEFLKSGHTLEEAKEKFTFN